MKEDIENLIAELGPTLSSNVVGPLTAKGIDARTARQQVSRARGNVMRLKGMTFPNRESFLYHKDQYQSDDFKANLAEALESSGSAYGRLLMGLAARGGTAPTKFLPIISGQPILNAKKQILHSVVESRVEAKSLIQKAQIGDTDMTLLWNVDQPSDRRRAVMIVEDIVLASIRTWFMKVGYTSSNAPTVRGLHAPLPTFAQFAWDLVAPSYLHSIRGYADKKVVNGFIVADILLGREVTLKDLSGFLNKWNAIAFQKRSTRFQPVFIADLFHADALQLLRERGCMVAIPEIIFGEEAAKQLMSLANTIENAAKLIRENPEAVFKLMNQISRWEGASLNTRGIILEMMVGSLYTSSGYTIMFRQQVKDNDGKRAEIDVKAVNKAEAVCCECKAYGPGKLINKDEVKDWVDRCQPRIKEWLETHSATLPQSKRFEFYVSTDYTPDARAYADSITATHRKQPVVFLSGVEIQKKLRAMNESALIEAFREQFC
jgi:hypothetical protein